MPFKLVKAPAMAVRPPALNVLGVGRAEVDRERFSTLGLRGHDDEVELKGHVLSWRAGGCTQKSFTLQPQAGRVIEASWCQFSCLEQNAASKFSLCALQSELITIFESDGPVHVVPLPFRASRLWPACDGIIIERQGSQPPSDSQQLGAPLLFSLLHPLEELRPLHFAPMDETQEVSLQQRVLFSSTQVAAPLLVTLHKESGTMAVWVTRQRTVPAAPLDITYMEDSVRSIGDGSKHDVDMVVEIVLEEVWSEKLSGQEPPETIFVSNDWRGGLLLCFVFAAARTLRTLQVACKVVDRGLPSFRLTRGDTLSNIIAAAPVQGTGRPCLVDTVDEVNDVCTDLLALDSSGTLALYAGDRRLCAVPCLSEIEAAGSSQLGAREFDDSRQDGESSFSADSIQLLGLRDSVANRVSLKCSNGGLYRVALDFGVSSPVVSACLMAMQDCTVLPQTLAFSLRTDTIRCSHNQATMVVPDSDDVEWSTFCRIVLTLVDEVLAQARESCGEPETSRTAGAETSPVESSKKKHRASSSLASSVELNSSDGSLLDIPADDSDWDMLVASDYHRGHPAQSVFDQLASQHPAMGGDVSSMQMRQSAAGTDRAPASPSSPSGEEPEPENDSDAHCTWLASLSTSSADFGMHVSTFMQVIHLVYEDLKLDVLTSSERTLRPLATLLHKLALRLNLMNHVDHYVRDFGEIFPVPGVGHAVPAATSAKMASFLSVDKMACAPVPSIYRWLHTCVRNEPDHSLSVSGMSAHGTMGSELCHATRKICFLYQLLVEGNVAREFAIRKNFGMAKTDKENTSKRLHKNILRSVSAVLFEGRHGGGSKQAAAPPASPIDEELQTTSNAESDGCEILGRVSQIRTAATSSFTATSVHEKVVLGMVSVELTPADLDCLPIAVAIPLRESLWACRHQPPPHWPSVAYELMGREDLACSTGENSELSRASSSMATLSMPSQPLSRTGQDSGLPFHMSPETETDGTPSTRPEAVCEGTELDTELPYLRFGRDQRLKEVQRVMRSSRPGALRVARAPETNDHEFLEQQQKKLQLQAQRTMALPVGRGMFTLFTARMTVTDPLPIPALNLSGRLPENNAVVSMDTASLPSDLQKWPNFHNGVAAGLRIPPQQSHATRTWIVYNKPDKLTDEHAGVLMALGLTGQLSSLASADLVWYLSQRHDTTAVGVMLGMAAARRGSMDNTISKMLCMHILAFHPPTFPELDVSSNLQTAAIMGIALLYQGTANRFMTEVLLGEIGRRASDSISVDREGYSLAAGIALGFVTLGRGNGAPGLADLRIEDRLRRFMTGGKVPDASANGTSVANYASQAQCSRIKEGEVVNVDITAPAATLALGLMYLRTNNVAVGEQLSIPDTHFLLDYVRPDFILLRVLAKNLVLWDSIEPTKTWAENQIPAMIQTALAAAELPASEQDDEIDHETMDMEAVRHAHWNIIAGVCLSLGLRFAGQADLRAQQLLLTYIRYFQAYSSGRGPGGATLSSLDKPIMETCFNVVILSLSLVMAGTGHLETFRLLRKLRKRCAPELTYGNHMAVSMAIGFLFLGGGCATLQTSNEAIGSLVAALYPRFPLTTRDNRYHLQAFRHLYVLAVEPRFIETRDVDTNEPVYVPLKLTLHTRKKRSSQYQSHENADSTMDSSVGASSKSGDGWRGVPSIPSDDDEDEIGKQAAASDLGSDETILRRISPCLLPKINRLARIEVETPRYWPVVLHLNAPEDEGSGINEDGTTATPAAENVWRERRIIYVKRKTGHLPYADDPHGVRSILARPFPKDGFGTERGSAAGLQAEFVRAFSADPNVLAFVTHFCGAQTGGQVAPSHTGLLYECLTRNKPEMLSVYMALSQIVRDLPHARSCEGIWNLKLLFAYYDYRWGIGNESRPPGPGGTVSSEAGMPPPVRSESTFDGDIAEDASEPLIQFDFQAWLRASIDTYFEQGRVGTRHSTADCVSLEALKHYATLAWAAGTGSTSPSLPQPAGAVAPSPARGSAALAPGGLSDSGPQPMEFALFLVYFDLPPPTVLASALERSGLQSDQGQTEATAAARLAACLGPGVPVNATLKLAKAWVH